MGKLAEDSFIVKACGNKSADIATMFDIISDFRQEQISICGEQKIDARIGILVGQKHSSPDFISQKEAVSILKDAPPDSIVVVTHLDQITELVELVDEMEGAAIQLHRKNANPEHVEELKSRYSDRQFWHVIHALQASENPFQRQIDEARRVATAHELVAAGVEVIILDTYDAKNDRAGGTGIAVDRGYAKRFQHAFKATNHSGKLVIAGGLKPYTVAEAIDEIQPDGVDANTGLNFSHHNRAKDPLKVKPFYGAALVAKYDIHPSEEWVLAG